MEGRKETYPKDGEMYLFTTEDGEEIEHRGKEKTDE